MLRIDINFLLTMINLAVLYLLLKKFLIGPIMRIMEQREAMIADGIKNANEQQEKAKVLRQQYEDALSGAKAESFRMLEEAKTSAKLEYSRIINDADKKAQKILESARETVDMEREQTLRDMKSQVASLAMDAARKIVEGKCDEGNGQEIYSQFLKDAGDFHDGEENG